MTDIMKLIERLYNSYDAETLCADAARAIEALQTENERLLREVVNRNQRALDGDKAMKVLDTTVTELEALQAKLDEWEKAAATGGWINHLQEECNSMAAKLYAAPKESKNGN